MSPKAGQPYRLHLLQALANSWGDPDVALLPFQHGVPTGAVSALPPSLHWPAKKPDSALPPDLEICEGNWKMAEDEPETVQSLLRNEIANNWIVETGLSIAEAWEKWPLGIAVGKLNVVFAERKEPRPVLDSAVCQVKTRCHLPERLSLPMASDLALSTQPEDTPGAFVGASIDCRSALKSMAFHYLPFKENSITIECAILGAVLAARQVRGLLAWKPHKAFLFVDDLLCALFQDSAPDMFALVVLFFCAIAAQISWKKAQFQDSLVWCGWEINFSHDTIQLVSAKLTKLDALIKALLGSSA